MIALFQSLDAGTDVDHDPGTLVAKNRREQPFRIGARQREFIGMADAGRLDLDQNFARFRAFKIDCFDGQRRTCLVCNRRSCLHHSSPF